MLYGLFSANLVSLVAAGYVNSGQRVFLGRVCLLFLLVSGNRSLTFREGQKSYLPFGLLAPCGFCGWMADGYRIQ